MGEEKPTYQKKKKRSGHARLDPGETTSLDGFSDFCRAPQIKKVWPARHAEELGKCSTVIMLTNFASEDYAGVMGYNS